MNTHKNNDLTSGPDSLQAQECRGDFWLMLKQAIAEAGGSADCADRLKNLPFVEVINFLAQNGVRMVYLKGKHVDQVGVRKFEPFSEVVADLAKDGAHMIYDKENHEKGKNPIIDLGTSHD